MAGGRQVTQREQVMHTHCPAPLSDCPPAQPWHALPAAHMRMPLTRQSLRQSIHQTAAADQPLQQSKHQATAADPTGRLTACPQVLEQMQRQGKARAIGVSNYSSSHLPELVARAAVKPAVNQVGVVQSGPDCTVAAAVRKAYHNSTALAKAHR